MANRKGKSGSSDRFYFLRLQNQYGQLLQPLNIKRHLSLEGKLQQTQTVYWASLIAHLVKNLPAMQETPVWFLGWEIHWRRDRLPTPVFLVFPCGSVGKELACNVGDLGSIPGLGRSPGEGKGYPL